jgi:ketosteroid isomerase-like protein
MQFACCLSGLWPKAFPLPPVLRTGDPENSRSRSLGDNRPKPPGGYNEIRLVVALVGLAISFALLAFAQQKDTVDPQLLEQINATISKKYDEAVNNNDAAAVAPLYTEDAVFVADTGPIYGREAIEKWYTDVFKSWHPKYNIEFVMLGITGIGARLTKSQRYQLNTRSVAALASMLDVT